MIYSGCSSVCGTTHSYCQDYSLTDRIAENITIMVAADGLGSEPKSEIGAKLACETVIAYVKSELNKVCGLLTGDFNSTKNKYVILNRIIHDSFMEAVNRISVLAKSFNENINIYNTTLMVALEINGVLFWGHSGDGAIIKIGCDGEICELTVEQSGTAASEVFPLLAGEKYWSFGTEYEDAFAYMMVTDGVLSFLKWTFFDNDATQNYFYNVLKSAELERYSLDELMNRVVIAPEMTSATSDDRTMALMINDRSSCPQYGEFYYNIHELSTDNADGAEYKMSIEEWMNRHCSGMLHSKLSENEIAMCFYGAGKDTLTMRMVVPYFVFGNENRHQRLWKSDELVYNAFIIFRMLDCLIRNDTFENNTDILIQEIPCIIFKNMDDTALKIYEYEKFMVADIEVATEYMGFCEDITNVISTYRYQMLYYVYKVCSRLMGNGNIDMTDKYHTNNRLDKSFRELQGYCDFEALLEKYRKIKGI